MKVLCLLVFFFCIAPFINASVPKSVFVAKIKTADIYDTLSYPAQILPKIEANVLAEYQGFVEKIFVSLGKQVRKGENLLSVKQIDPAYNYVPMKITSPIGGVVTQVLTTEGNVVGKGQILIKITDPSEYKIKIEITSSDIAGLKQGMQGRILLSGGKKSFSVRIVGIAPVLDLNTGTSSAELELITTGLNDVQVLPMGEICQVMFQTNFHRGIEVADDAINYFGTKTFLSIIEEKKIKKVEVEVGPRRNGSAEIVNGLKDNDVVVVRSTSFLGEGDAVDIQNEKEI